jgi:hypothetical protein
VLSPKTFSEELPKETVVTSKDAIIESLHASEGPRATAWLRRSLNDQAEAEDGLQSVFLSLWCSSGFWACANESQRRAFFWTSIRHRALQSLRGRKLLTSLDEIDGDSVPFGDRVFGSNPDFAYELFTHEVLARAAQEMRGFDMEGLYPSGYETDVNCMQAPADCSDSARNTRRCRERMRLIKSLRRAFGIVPRVTTRPYSAARAKSARAA